MNMRHQTAIERCICVNVASATMWFLIIMIVCALEIRIMHLVQERVQQNFN